MKFYLSSLYGQKHARDLWKGGMLRLSNQEPPPAQKNAPRPPPQKNMAHKKMFLSFM